MGYLLYRFFLLLYSPKLRVDDKLLLLMAGLNELYLCFQLFQGTQQLADLILKLTLFITVFFQNKFSLLFHLLY